LPEQLTSTSMNDVEEGSVVGLKCKIGESWFWLESRATVKGLGSCDWDSLFFPSSPSSFFAGSMLSAECSKDARLIFSNRRSGFISFQNMKVWWMISLSLSFFLRLHLCRLLFLTVCRPAVFLSFYRSIDLSIYRSIFLFIFVFFYLSFYRSIDLSIFLTIYMHISIYLSIFLSMHISINPSIYLSKFLYCLSISLSVCLSIYVSVCLYVCMSVCLFCLSAWLCIFLSIYPSLFRYPSLIYPSLSFN
jgi:hypothetical protein